MKLTLKICIPLVLCGLVGCDTSSSLLTNRTASSSNGALTSMVLMNALSADGGGGATNGGGSPGQAQATVAYLTLSGQLDEEAQVRVNNIEDQLPDPLVWLVRLPMGGNGLPFDPGLTGNTTATLQYRAVDPAGNASNIDVTVGFLPGTVTPP